MTKTNSKLSLVNFDLKGNKTIIRAKYDFIIKLLNWLGQKDYITIDYVSPEPTPEVKLNITSTPSGIGLPIQLRKRLEAGMKTHYTKKSIKSVGKKISLKKKLPIKKNGNK